MNYGSNDNEFSELYEGVFDAAPLRADPSEVEEINFHTISELEEIIVAGKFPIAPWFTQLIRWYTSKRTLMEVL